MRQTNKAKQEKSARIYFLIALGAVLLFTQISACASDNGHDLFAQYNLLCDIIEVEYAEFEKSDQSTSDKMVLIKAIEEKMDKKISNDQVKKSYSLLLNIGGDDPYELLKHVVKSRTGKDFSCDAFKALTQVTMKSNTNSK
jgi:hypothetical protein